MVKKTWVVRDLFFDRSALLLCSSEPAWVARPRPTMGAVVVFIVDDDARWP
jgi:hypothetical protein